jgi:hypothetical protein
VTSPLEQKVKIAGPVVITANRVSDGAVIYLRADGGWSTDLGASAVTADATTARALMQAAIADDLRAVGAYIAPVGLVDEGIVRPGNLRERIRLGGPTINLPVASGLDRRITRTPHAGKHRLLEPSPTGT